MRKVLLLTVLFSLSTYNSFGQQRSSSKPNKLYGAGESRRRLDERGFVQAAYITAQRAHRADLLIARYIQQEHVPGASVAIVSAGLIVYSKGFGNADLENGVAVTTRTLFPTASVLKPLTAVAILQLAQHGKLELDASVQKYCAAYPNKKWAVTIRDLLRHQAGLSPSAGTDVFNRDHFNDVNSVVAKIADKDQTYEPRNRSVYANDGYTLLACAIEGASGQQYDLFLRQNVLAKANMQSTQPDDWYRLIPNRARSYVIRTPENTKEWQGLWTETQLKSIPLNVHVNADPVDPTRELGAAGYVSNPNDLARFVIALERGNLLTFAMRQEMVSEQKTANGESSGFGLGWRVKTIHGERTYNVFGSVWTGSSAILVLPERKFAVVICTNLEFEQPTDLAYELARVWGYMKQN
jgi:CubicO group peptidase (beta-lactamase class C family)